MKIVTANVEVLKIPVSHSYHAAGRTVDSNWHVLASVPAGDMVEYMPRSMEILQNMPVPSGGKIAPLDALGHGLQLDEEAVAHFSV